VSFGYPRNARSIALKSVVRCAQALTVVCIEQCATVSALDDVVCYHDVAAGSGRLAAPAILNPLAAPVRTPAYRKTPSAMLWRL
jgi:hypothetical protein